MWPFFGLRPASIMLHAIARRSTTLGQWPPPGCRLQVDSKTLGWLATTTWLASQAHKGKPADGATLITLPSPPQPVLGRCHLQTVPAPHPAPYQRSRMPRNGLRSPHPILTLAQFRGSTPLDQFAPRVILFRVSSDVLGCLSLLPGMCRTRYPVGER